MHLLFFVKFMSGAPGSDLHKKTGLKTVLMDQLGRFSERVSITQCRWM